MKKVTTLTWEKVLAVHLSELIEILDRHERGIEGTDDAEQLEDARKVLSEYREYGK